jgi:hypothetical protein
MGVGLNGATEDFPRAVVAESLEPGILVVRWQLAMRGGFGTGGILIRNSGHRFLLAPTLGRPAR